MIMLAVVLDVVGVGGESNDSVVGVMVVTSCFDVMVLLVMVVIGAVCGGVVGVLLGVEGTFTIGGGYERGVRSYSCI